ncbi:MAG: NAD-dependent epimerase/dehydratase family protein [Myxococcota bacterium]
MSDGSRECIAITGLGGFIGQRLAERLLQRHPAPRVLGLGLRRPLRLEGRIDFEPVDLTEPTADAHLAEVLERREVDVVVHTAFRQAPTPDIDGDHELETVGSLHVMSACAAAGVRRLVIASSTTLYGPRPDNPNFLEETHPLRGHPEAHCVQNRVEVEEMAAEWAARNPDIDLTILRQGWVMGPTYDDHVVRFFERPVVPVVLGYDPLLQFVHEDDLMNVYERASVEPHPGVFNVVGSGVLPLSTLLALAGKRAWPLPSRLLHRLAYYPSQAESGDPPKAFFDYLRYLWVAAGEKGWKEFGDPIYNTREAWISFVSSRRMRRYR